MATHVMTRPVLRRTRPAPRPTAKRLARLVLAEDDVEMRRMLAQALRHDGYEVIEAANGSELLEQLEFAQRLQDPVDLVITDVRMPGLSGLQALDWLQKVQAWHAPVIAITAFGDAQIHAQARQVGARVLDKPFDLDELRRLIDALRLHRSS